MFMRPDSNPVQCPWTAEDLNDKSISFVPARNGSPLRAVGQILAADVLGGLYIQICLNRHNAQPVLYWLNQEEAARIERSRAGSGVDFVLN